MPMAILPPEWNEDTEVMSALKTNLEATVHLEWPGMK